MLSAALLDDEKLAISVASAARTTPIATCLLSCMRATQQAMQHATALRATDPAAAERLDHLSTRLQLAAAAITFQFHTIESSVRDPMASVGGVVNTGWRGAIAATTALRQIGSGSRRGSGRDKKWGETKYQTSDEELVTGQEASTIGDQRHATLLQVLSTDDGTAALKKAVSIQAKVLLSRCSHEIIRPTDLIPIRCAPRTSFPSAVPHGPHSHPLCPIVRTKHGRSGFHTCGVYVRGSRCCSHSR